MALLAAMLKVMPKCSFSILGISLAQHKALVLPMLLDLLYL
jgi:hypothetical protein